VSTPAQKSVVNVRIAGDEYTIRADATPEYTQECAAYVDGMITEILEQGSLVEAHKAAILAALAITDQLFRVRQELHAHRAETARIAAELSAELEHRLAS
jgi:cell division protein ZapA